MKFTNSEIDNLAKVLKENELTSIKYEQGDCKITLSTEGAASYEQNVTSASPESVSSQPKVEDSNLSEIKCPLIGHFYVAPAPGKEPFIKVGDKIKAGDVIGIIQAMKVSNEIKSEISGEVVEIVALDSQFVDYDTTLVLVKE